MFKKSWIIALLLAGLILPVCPIHEAAKAEGGADLDLTEICDARPSPEKVKESVMCFLPPRPPTQCRDCLTAGVAVAILKHNPESAVDKPPEVFFKCTVGSANVERREPITKDTVFDLASITKQFTAAGIMMLIEDPKVKLKNGYRLTVETNLSDILDFPPAKEKDIILADLLTHQSGLPDYIDEYQRRHKFNFDKLLLKGNPSWYETMDHRAGRVELTNQMALELIEKAVPKRGTAPGTDFNYSNSGYVVLAQIIEKLSGKSYKEFMREKIFKPLGMTNTFVFDDKSGKIPNHAFPYRQTNGRYFAIDGYSPINFVYGDGNIHSTLDDLIKWIQALDKIEHGQEGALLKRETLMTAFQSTRLREDLRKALRYGFGWFVARKDKEMGGPSTRVIYHGGDWYGFHSFMLDGHIEKSGKTVCELTMIVLSNFEAEKHDSSQNRECHLARDLSKLFWGGDKSENIILDDTKLDCGSVPKPACVAPPLRCN
ncbi:MAG TPA: serine hydrolase domain-containing protein [Blastocatellia bacterium]|nr:serine hydrolase domain-containing protein [Blastocatellia bacterium]